MNISPVYHNRAVFGGNVLIQRNSNLHSAFFMLRHLCQYNSNVLGQVQSGTAGQQ